MNIYVGNLPYSVTEDELRRLFEQYGDVQSVYVIKDRYSGIPKGFGFVEMGSQEEADHAIEKLDGHEVDGRKIKVNEARPRSHKPADSGRTDKPRSKPKT
ncbi:RNA recognition motif domain-containing protein [Methylohalobius crimeensis]|uniref:RNA recognition motif domain-containing protein n=1 Tax=Methylohalobius crimeensis TaxID=244365 RepID=UPI0003B338CD|nr:RNA-binding protein [Methylohalobius crimeensis]